MSEMTRTRAIAMRDAMERNARKQVYGDWLYVQPLERRTTSRRKHTCFDVWFDSYRMGDANYEGDVPLASLARIRAAQQVDLYENRFTHKGVTRTVYFVGPGGQNLRNKILGCQVWLTLDGSKSCMPSYFEEHFLSAPMEKAEARIVAWWSLNDDVMWTFDPNVAYDMVAAINGRS